MTLYFKNRQIVVPGELLAEGGYKPGEGTFREGNCIYSSVVGLVEAKGKVVQVVAFEGAYIPKVGDVVIGKVIDVKMTSWRIDINSPYQATMHPVNIFERRMDPLKEDLRRYFDVGDTLVAKIMAFDRTRAPLLTTKERGLGKLQGGYLVNILPTKIPRLIGRKGSMINMIKKETGCQIVIGQNGVVWVSGKSFEDEERVIKAIRQIEREAHTSGLTDRVRELIHK
ncbi:MAG: exosome complex RNA-binding protein Rrp4 [Candidatus Freyarchaeota archaeon]|nr:RNA-binding protein [Candidatus Jordarchaeia archaeon]MBS7278680.1 RNA-binding protein [Candidatus Jordarchaeia archaeon]